MRSMAEPHLKAQGSASLFNKTQPFSVTNRGQPDHYSEYVARTDALCDTTWDYLNGCVHFNSGVLNKLAYLISEGGEHKGQTVAGIGRQKLARIAYRALTTKLNATSSLVHAADTFVSACTDLVGAAAGITAQDCVEVENARRAVGLGTDSWASAHIRKARGRRGWHARAWRETFVPAHGRPRALLARPTAWAAPGPTEAVGLPWIGIWIGSPRRAPAGAGGASGIRPCGVLWPERFGVVCARHQHQPLGCAEVNRQCSSPCLPIFAHHGDLFGRHTVNLGHRFDAADGLFGDAALASLIERTPAHAYHVNTMDVTTHAPNTRREGTMEGLSGADALDAVRNAPHRSFSNSRTGSTATTPRLLRSIYAEMPRS